MKTQRGQAYLGTDMAVIGTYMVTSHVLSTQTECVDSNAPLGEYDNQKDNAR